MKKQYYIVLILLLVISLTLPACTQEKSHKMVKPVKPNIIFILADDMGYGDLGVLFQNQRMMSNNRSKPFEQTPNLDQLARDGAELTQDYCAAPVCAPSRASILLGQSQGHANVRNNQFDKALADNWTLASVLKAAGYATAAFGKWGLQGREDDLPNCTAHPLNRGFDYFFGYLRHKDAHQHYPKEGLYVGSKPVYMNRTDITPELDKCYTADLWTAAAKKWIVDHEKKDPQQPFFIYLAYDTPHAVLELPTQAYPKGGGLHGGMQWIGKPHHMINTASGKVDSYVNPEYAHATYDNDHNPATPEVPWPNVYKRYAEANRRIDDGVGDIMQLLKDLHINKNTMVVFTSDNGPSRESYLPKRFKPNNPSFFRSFGPFDGIKRDCWEGGVRMPTLAEWPGHIPAGRIVKTPTISYDWMATFAEMAGFPPPAVSDGVSLLPSLTGVGKQQQGTIYIEYFENGRTPNYHDFLPQHRGRIRKQMQVIRLGNYVGVRYNIKSANDNFEIYNVVKDPEEGHNLAGKPKMAFLQKEMKAKVLWDRMPNNSAPRPYDNALLPAVSDVKTEKGIIWKAYDGSFPWIPQVATLSPIDTGYSARPEVSVCNKKYTVLFFTGFIRVPIDGEYTFFVTAGPPYTNTRALLRIHNAVVIDEGFNYFSGSENAGEIKLKAGLHPFRLYFYKKNEGSRKRRKPVLKFAWQGPGIEKQSIPASVFYHAVNRLNKPH